MPNILICDDEKDIVNALKIYLSDPDYTLYVAYNGKEALSALKDHEIHLVLLDIMMPVMDGITAMAKIRETSNVPIIVLTFFGCLHIIDNAIRQRAQAVPVFFFGLLDCRFITL